MRKVIFLALLLSSFCLFLSYRPNTQAPSYNVIGCQILNNDGAVLWSLPGGMRCVFFEDGSLVAAINNQLVMYNKTLNILWRRDIFNHHQLNRSGNRILVMSDEHILENNDLVRYDVLLILDLSGNILNNKPPALTGATQTPPATVIVEAGKTKYIPLVLVDGKSSLKIQS